MWLVLILQRAKFSFIIPPFLCPTIPTKHLTPECTKKRHLMLEYRPRICYYIVTESSPISENTLEECDNIFLTSVTGLM